MSNEFLFLLEYSFVDRFFFKVNAFARNGMGFEAVELYQEMPNNLRDEISHVCVLNACSHSGLLDQAKKIFNEVPIKTQKIFAVMVCSFIWLIIFNINVVLIL